MDDLEKILRKVEELSKDSKGYITLNLETEENVVAQQFKLPKEIVEKARLELREFYSSSPWYSARYNAGRALKIPFADLNKELELWIDQLSGDLDAFLPAFLTKPPKPEEPKFVPHHDPDSGEYWGFVGCIECAQRIEEYNIEHGSWLTELRMWEESPPSILVEDAPDNEKRTKAKKDLGKLYIHADKKDTRQDISLLLQIPHVQFLSDELIRYGKLSEQELVSLYHSNQAQSTVRSRAGKCLGYSDRKIWINEHPKTAIFLGTSMAGIAAGIGYFLYQYFSR